VSALIAVVQIATEVGVVDILIHFGGHFEHDEAGRVIARAPAGAVGGSTQRTGETKVHGSADKPAEAAIHLALRRDLNGTRRKLIVREPAARCLGKRSSEGLSVVLVETLSMGDEGYNVPRKLDSPLR
jgi:hypothetical protein